MLTYILPLPELQYFQKGNWPSLNPLLWGYPPLKAIRSLTPLLSGAQTREMAAFSTFPYIFRLTGGTLFVSIPRHRTPTWVVRCAASLLLTMTKSRTMQQMGSNLSRPLWGPPLLFVPFYMYCWISSGWTNTCTFSVIDQKLCSYLDWLLCLRIGSTTEVKDVVIGVQPPLIFWRKTTLWTTQPQSSLMTTKRRRHKFTVPNSLCLVWKVHSTPLINLLHGEELWRHKLASCIFDTVVQILWNFKWNGSELSMRVELIIPDNTPLKQANYLVMSRSDCSTILSPYHI